MILQYVEKAPLKAGIVKLCFAMLRVADVQHGH